MCDFAFYIVYILHSCPVLRCGVYRPILKTKFMLCMISSILQVWRNQSPSRHYLPHDLPHRISHGLEVDASRSINKNHQKGDGDQWLHFHVDWLWSYHGSPEFQCYYECFDTTGWVGHCLPATDVPSDTWSEHWHMHHIHYGSTCFVHLNCHASWIGTLVLQLIWNPHLVPRTHHETRSHWHGTCLGQGNTMVAWVPIPLHWYNVRYRPSHPSWSELTLRLQIQSSCHIGNSSTHFPYSRRCQIRLLVD